jgi:GTP-dependent phosphoenolpyruvate carboxykinase
MRNETLETWILLASAHTAPARIHWCDGSEAELKELREQLQAEGIDWALERIQRSVDARSTPIGWIPRSLDVSGLRLGTDMFDPLLQVDAGGWFAEAEANGVFLARFGKRLPPELHSEHRALVSRLRAATN